MKNTKATLFFIVAALAFIFPSCTRDNGNEDQVTNTVTTGAWRVTLFTDSGNDETSDFNGYSFTFRTNGVLFVSSGAISQEGTWSFNSSSAKLIIDLGPKTDANKPLGELTDDWRITSYSDTEIQLADDNAASNEFLTFTRN